MSTSSTESGTSPPPLEDENELVKPVSELVKRPKPGNHPTRKSNSELTPIIIAAYRHGDPCHKRRVKVPAHITWRQFLELLCSRLEVGRDCDIRIYDESGIEIVSVEDLVPNDVLVVREIPKAVDVSQYRYNPARGAHTKHGDDRGQSASLRRPHEASHQHPPPSSVATGTRNRIHDHYLQPMGVPLLSHFIKANNYGYYFLAEMESPRASEEGGGKGSIRRTHCIVKVPSVDRSLGELREEGGREGECDGSLGEGVRM